MGPKNLLFPAILQIFFSITFASNTIKLFHAIDDGDFTLRHDFKADTVPALTYLLKGQQEPLESKKSIYNRYKLQLVLPTGRTLSTWVDHVALKDTCYTDIIEFFLDNDENITSFGYHIRPRLGVSTKCTKRQFSTKVKVYSPNISPGPATDSYLQQIQVENDKKKSEAGQPTSFFGKYWMYIAIFMVVMSMGGG